MGGGGLMSVRNFGVLARLVRARTHHPLQMSSIIASDLVPLKSRALFQGLGW